MDSGYLSGSSWNKDGGITEKHYLPLLLETPQEKKHVRGYVYKENGRCLRIWYIDKMGKAVGIGIEWEWRANTMSERVVQREERWYLCLHYAPILAVPIFFSSENEYLHYIAKHVNDVYDDYVLFNEWWEARHKDGYPPVCSDTIYGVLMKGGSK